jgi:hypothetical protein
MLAVGVRSITFNVAIMVIGYVRRVISRQYVSLLLLNLKQRFEHDNKTRVENKKSFFVSIHETVNVKIMKQSLRAG